MFFHAYGDHHFQFEQLDPNERHLLPLQLTGEQFNLLLSISECNKANFEISRGRYPYEERNGRTAYPLGDEGRVLAEKWIDLARGTFTVS